uniref:CARD domain-containing protein n=1 Tax=Callorhinchus milii TaxID=7868 RepID=A0A4W3K7H7_CALMI
MVLMHPTGIFTNPYAIEVLQRKKSELVAGIANTDHLLDWLIENGLVSEGQAEAIRALLAAGAHIYAMDSDSQTPLHLAAPHQSHSAVVKLMLREEGKRADRKSSFLHMAAQRDESGFARTLLRHGAPVDAKDGRRHQTPLFYAVSRGHINTAKVLLEAGAQVVDGPGLIDAAFSTGDQALIALMLTQAREVGPATIFRAVERDLPKVVAALAEMGADVNSRDGSGRTPALHLAVMSDSPSLVHLLLEKGMDPNITGAGEQTPLHLAARHDRYKMVDVLIGAGSKPNSYEHSYLSLSEAPLFLN